MPQTVVVDRKAECQCHEAQEDATLYDAQDIGKVPSAPHLLTEEGLEDPRQREQSTEKGAHPPPYAQLHKHQQRHEGYHGTGDRLSGKQGREPAHYILMNIPQITQMTRIYTLFDVNLRNSDKNYTD